MKFSKRYIKYKNKKMKKLIFIDNDLEAKANENLSYAYRTIKYNSNADVKRSDFLLIHEFHKVVGQMEDRMFDTNNVIITWSMFTENHFRSYDQLCDFMVTGGLIEIKGKIFIDTATYLKDTLTRAIEHYNQAVYIIRCIENNFIIHYDETGEKFYRLRFDVQLEEFLKNEDIDLNELLNS